MVAAKNGVRENVNSYENADDVVAHSESKPRNVVHGLVLLELELNGEHFGARWNVSCTRLE